MTEDIIRVTKEILKLNKDVFLTMDIILVKKIPLLITLIHTIDLTDTSHLPTHKDRDLLNSFCHIFVFYLKLGFKITKVHADGECAPVRELIA